MIQVTPHMRILLAVEPADFRKGIDGLAAMCRSVLDSDPFTGCVFVFRNKPATAIKILAYDGQGFWLCQKRLSKGKFQWWPSRNGNLVDSIAAHELQLLIWNGDPKRAVFSPMWKKIAVG